MEDLPDRENLKVDFRVEGFNVLNHTEFGNPFAANSVYIPVEPVLTGNPGLISSSTGNPRILQAALKVTF